MGTVLRTMALVPDIGGADKDMNTLLLGKALVTAPLVSLTSQLDTRLHGVDPWKVVAGTAGATLVAAYLYNLTQQRVPLTARVKKYIFKMMRKIPVWEDSSLHSWPMLDFLLNLLTSVCQE